MNERNFGSLKSRIWIVFTVTMVFTLGVEYFFKNFWITAITMAVFSFGSAYFLINTLFTPFITLHSHMEELVRGVWNKIEDKGNGEFGYCFYYYNQFIQYLMKMNSDFQELSKRILDGKINEKIDYNLYPGEFRKVFEYNNKIFIEIIKPIDEALTVLKGMADGNLSREVSGDYKGDHAQIKHAVNATISSFNRMLGQLKRVISDVDQASKKVSESSNTLSNGASKQSSSIEEISSSMTEIGGQINKNAEHASQALSLSNQVKENAAAGNNQMIGMLKAMNEINDSSQNISKIIKVIDEIAFQTNLLALNAAVEAARAGKHGKGFAVVAEEVRNLAARSAEAAKETTQLIEDSKSKVQHGSNIAEGTANALNQIVGGITEVNDLVNQIAAASSEQAQGVELVNKGIRKIKEVTQDNTVTAEQSAAAAEELISFSMNLSNMVKQFTLINRQEEYYNDRERSYKNDDDKYEQQDNDSNREEEYKAPAPSKFKTGSSGKFSQGKIKLNANTTSKYHDDDLNLDHDYNKKVA